MRRFGFCLLFAVIVLAGHCFAGTIHLKDGTSVKTRGTWEEGDQVFGFVEGEIKSYPKEDVARWDNVDETKPEPEPETKADNPSSSKRPGHISTREKAKKETRLESGRAITQENAVACLTESDLDDMIRFVAANDRSSFQSYIDRKKCIVCKAGLKVTVLKYPGMFGGKAQFAFQGYKFWTTSDGLRYR